MNKISVKGDKILIIECGYDPYIILAIRAILGARWVKEFHHWELIPCVRNIPQLLDFAEKFSFVFDFGVKELLEQELLSYRTNLASSSKTLADIIVPGIMLELLPFQLAGVDYASRTKKCFIADQPGLGKTCQALATVQLLDAYPAVVVCPAILKENWKREVTKFFPGRTAEIVNNKNYKQLTCDIVILNYDMLNKYLPYLRLLQPRAVVFDEIHMCKDHKRQRAKAALGLAEGISVRLGLTGTPILSRPSELPSQLKILGQMEQFGNEWQFLQRYCGAKKEYFGWNVSGVSNSEELNEILRKTCYIRRTKDEVLPELPPKRQSEIMVDIDNMPEYKAAQDDIISYLVAESHKDEDFLSEIKKMMPSDRHNAKRERSLSVENKARNAEHLVKIMALKKLAIKGKLSAINSWIDDFLETEEKLVVFAHHRHIVEALANRPNTVKIIGGTRKKDDRQKAIDSFQNDDKTRLIVCSLMAGGVGITLTAASNIAITELPWTPAAVEQAEDREHRIGQTKPVNVYFFLGAGTIDEDIFGLLQEKKIIVDSVVDGKQVSVLSGVIEKLKGRR